MSYLTSFEFVTKIANIVESKRLISLRDKLFHFFIIGIILLLATVFRISAALKNSTSKT
ncbi:hypothetical protein [Psychromonas sp. SP041]|uniref:hypothetical protein n=1 Tax=Psychromonas sp. SP041 TaxID=1365007 RepID=UPI00040B75F8|nr:hypothetical protein [Psychromonas sp. SP041]